MSEGKGTMEPAQIETRQEEKLEDMDTSPESRFISTVSNLVSNGKVDHLEILLRDGKHDKELNQVTWDLVPLLCTFLTTRNQEEKPDMIRCCELVFRLLGSASKPKELILVLLEQVGSGIDDVKFKVLLLPIQKCLLSMTAKRSHSLAMALETLLNHVQSLEPVGEDAQKLEGKERLLLQMDPRVRRICHVLAAFLDFLQPFVENAGIVRENNEEHAKERGDLINILLKLLNNPMKQLDMTHEMEEGTLRPGQDTKRPIYNETHIQTKTTGTKSEGRDIAERVVGFLSQLQPNFVKVVEEMKLHNARRDSRLQEARQHMDPDAPELESLEDYGIEEEIPPGGLQCLIYLTLGETLGQENFPVVYTRQYLLEFCLPFIATFLEKQVNLDIERGLKLLQSLLVAVPVESLDADLMELRPLIDTLNNLIQVVVHCPAKSLRQSALKIFPLLMTRFNSRGRFLYLQHLLNKSSHAGLVGYATGMLKDEIDRSLKQEKIPPFFKGAYLDRLLKYVFVLPDGATSDLLEESDRVLAALNLLRYLVIRDDPQQNVTGIWSSLSRIDDTYCKPLRTGLNMSRAHYKLEMDKAKVGEFVQKPGDPEFEVTAGGETMPAMTKEQQVNVIQRALFTFDMMDSVLARVAEIMDQQKKPFSIQ